MNSASTLVPFSAAAARRRAFRAAAWRALRGVWLALERVGRRRADHALADAVDAGVERHGDTPATPGRQPDRTPKV